MEVLERPPKAIAAPGTARGPRGRPRSEAVSPSQITCPYNPYAGEVALSQAPEKTILNQAISVDEGLAKDRSYNADPPCRTSRKLPFLNWDEHF